MEADLLALAESLGAQGHIRHQEQPLGTAHAVWCAEDLLEGETVVAFADTLFRADFTLDASADGHLFVKRIEDPASSVWSSSMRTAPSGGYAEKPEEPVSNLAMIGIYHFRDGAGLRREIGKLIDGDVRHGDEFQLLDAFRALTEQGAAFPPGGGVGLDGLWQPQGDGRDQWPCPGLHGRRRQGARRGHRREQHRPATLRNPAGAPSSAIRWSVRG